MVKRFCPFLVFVLALMVVAAPMAAHAKLGLLHRHKTLASLGAGYAAYKIAHHTGKNRTASGGHRNFMQRHPVLTGLGAAAMTHHVLKHH